MVSRVVISLKTLSMKALICSEFESYNETRKQYTYTLYYNFLINTV